MTTCRHLAHAAAARVASSHRRAPARAATVDRARRRTIARAAAFAATRVAAAELGSVGSVGARGSMGSAPTEPYWVLANWSISFPLGLSAGTKRWTRWPAKTSPG